MRFREKRQLRGFHFSAAAREGMAKTPKQREGAFIRSSLSCSDRGCGSLWSAQPRRVRSVGRAHGPRPPLAPALLVPSCFSLTLRAGNCPCCTSRKVGADPQCFASIQTKNPNPTIPDLVSKSRFLGERNNATRLRFVSEQSSESTEYPLNRFQVLFTLP